MTAREVVEWAKKYLEIEATAAAQMGGGLMNEVWRVEGDTVAVLKIYRDHSKENPGVELTTERGRFEAAALRLLDTDEELRALADGKVVVPELLFWNPAEAALAMSYLPHEFDIGVALEHGTVGEKQVGRLATWLAGVHRETSDRVELMRRFKNDGVQRTRLRVQYATVEDVLEEVGLEIDGARLREAGRRALALGRLLLEPGQCLVMGDLWPRSVLVRDQSLGIVDWEFCHYGRPIQDVAHFAAHLWLLADTAKDSASKIRLQNARSAFLEAYYASAGSFDEQELENGNVHAGCEIVMRTFGAFADTNLYDDDSLRRAAAHRGIDAMLGEWSPLDP